MREKSKMYRKIADNKLIFIGIGVGLLFWFLEAAIHAMIFYHGRLIEEILALNPHEAWMRSLVVCLFIVFGIYAQFIVNSRKRAEEGLQNSEARLRLILETVPSGFFMVDSDRKIVYWNKEAEGITGMKAGEIIGKDCLEALHCEECMKGCSLFDDKINKPIYGLECVLHIPGRDITISKNADIIKDSRGRTIAGIESFVDITGRKQAEEEKRRLEAQLLQAQKMEAIATLAGGIAHEFNNALVGVSGNIELLQMDLPDDKNIDKYIEIMKNSTSRMTDLTRRLLAYARGGKYQPRTISLNDFVKNTVPLIQHSIGPAIRVEMDLPSGISNIEADLPQMQMMLSAVLSNASEALEGEGLIRISTRDEKIDEEFAKTIPDLKPGLYVCLTIEDKGKGMDEETRSKVFDPFFTTKFQGRGLGMAAAYGIIKNHGGWISLDSELGKGTVVRICLPAVEFNVERAKETKAETSSGAGIILVVEDEEVVIDVMCTMLERLGYRILLAKTGSHAVDIARTFDGDIDLAILDIVLPDMGGKDVYPLIMKARPNLKVIVCSGYSIEGPAQEILDAGAQDFIVKPFDAEKVKETVKKVLG